MHVSRYLAKSVSCISSIPLSIAKLFASVILVAWLAIPTGASAQTVILVGTISDADTGSTIARAKISNQPSCVFTTTASDGTYQLNSDQIPSDSVSIFVVKPGYNESCLRGIGDFESGGGGHECSSTKNI